MVHAVGTSREAAKGAPERDPVGPGRRRNRGAEARRGLPATSGVRDVEPRRNPEETGLDAVSVEQREQGMHHAIERRAPPGAPALQRAQERKVVHENEEDPPRQQALPKPARDEGHHGLIEEDRHTAGVTEFLSQGAAVRRGPKLPSKAGAVAEQAGTQAAISLRVRVEDDWRKGGGPEADDG